jgi:alginate O-acetyltransferase complex protein AlgI
VVFSSVTFLFFFLPVFLVVYFFTPTIAGKNIVTLAFSFIFYSWGEPIFMLVLATSILFNTAAAVFVDRCVGRPRKWAVSLSIIANLSLLAVFKYGTFILVNLDWLLHPLGLHFPTVAIPLPLGISFFTFHCLSYVIDVYRRRFAANRRPIEIALYISMFPQLVAGPIVRYRTVSRQLRHRRHSWTTATIGARIFIIGLAQKVLIADQVSQFVEIVFDHTELATLAEAWSGLLAYTIQIYFDFAGYSNMAIGLGLILGFTLPRNFRMPYTSRSITEFWRRWHISLSQWLRDYLYIPLGGNRGGEFATYRNLITVFLLCGLWHGASWNFVLWGVWHGSFLVVERIGLGRLLSRLPGALSWTYAMLAVMGGWVLFRAKDLPTARHFWAALIGRHGVGGITFEVHLALQPAVALALAVGCVLAVVPRWVRFPRNQDVGALLDGVFTFMLLVVSMLYIAAGTYSPFLYFRF